ncbi:longitudinals lacking protein, isoforms H/M/V-like isoform X2 [Penaeus chinensis]|uniref:longitudinals lacking protein, isoforms H/M/V-like isoform X2 n=1 Tax=Penaeus chinensis TaxID=139456 RepID=UPI001FB5B245|nr:longitudinals lacking protein, isoforms H/M/V-like isoform X2 [Penaeus chinensis]
MEGGLLCLKWRDHRSTFFRMLSSVRKKELYCDATIACDGKFYPVHKLILSACSDYFEQMFELSENKNLMIVLTDINHKELETLLDYMYLGEVNILQSDLSMFMKAAEHLQIKGLAEPSESNQKKELTYNKRNLPQREDSCDAKKRRLSADEHLSKSRSVSINQSEHSVTTRSTMGGRDVCSEPKNQEEVSESVQINNTPNSDIVSPAQLASAELSCEAPANKRPDPAPTLAKAQDHNKPSSEVSSCEGSQVKVEDFNVKEEPEDWPQTDAGENSQMFGFSDPGLAYLAHASNLPVRAQGSAVINQMTTTQSQAPAELQSHPLPGPSGIQATSGGWEQQPPSTRLPSEDYLQYRSVAKGVSPGDRRMQAINQDRKARRRGRCGICPRKNDKKSAKQCSLCYKWVCKIHSVADGRVVLCDKCRPQQWFC